MSQTMEASILNLKFGRTFPLTNIEPSAPLYNDSPKSKMFESVNIPILIGFNIII